MEEEKIRTFEVLGSGLGLKLSSEHLGRIENGNTGSCLNVTMHSKDRY